MFFESGGLIVHLLPQPSVREPRENRGRLRHCKGLRTPTRQQVASPATDSAKRDREGGSEVASPKSGYRFGCARHGSARQDAALSGADFSVKEKDEASLTRECV